MNLYSIFYNLVKQIPPGKITTYGLLANALGDPIAARAVGVMLSQNPEPIDIPCHRVVKSDGTLGGFTHPEGIKEKIRLLKEEGIKIKNLRVQDFDSCLFKEFHSTHPLKILRKEQEKLREKLILTDQFSFESTTTVDISYIGRLAFSAFVTYSIKDNKVIEIKIYKDTITFPYIPTYLSYREGPIILKHLNIKKDQILILDGNGILHPLGLGLASYVGVKSNLPAIGVAKSLLCGTLINDEVYVNDHLAGLKLKSLYISPGHRVSVTSAYKIVKQLYDSGFSIKLAHSKASELRDHYCSSHNCGPF